MAFAFAVALLSASPCRAADPFEIQVYDATANAPGVFGLELHSNYVASGVKSAAGPQLPPDGQLHFTLEPSIGVTPWWELGGYFQTAVRSGGTFDYAGVKLRSKFVTPPEWQPHLRLGLNLELSLLPERYDENRWGSELRPIVAWENERFLFAANPIVGITLTSGSGAPTFEPAAMAKLKLFDGKLAAGLEYIGDLGHLDAIGPLRTQQHYLFEAVDLLGFYRLELNVGVGEGLTGASNPLVFKMIIGWAFDPALPAK